MASHIKTELIVGEHSGSSLQMLKLHINQEYLGGEDKTENGQ